MKNNKIEASRKELCKQLRTIAKEKGITQVILAEQLNVAQQKVSTWFSGEVSPHLDNFLKLANACGVEYVLKDGKIKG